MNEAQFDEIAEALYTLKAYFSCNDEILDNISAIKSHIGYNSVKNTHYITE